MIYDLLQELRKEFSDHREEAVKQSKDIAEIKADLKYHIKRTDLLEDLHKDNAAQIKTNNKRLEMLEEPKKAKKYLLKKWQFWAGVAVVTASAISKIAGLW
jgi:hypothetical protein